MLYQEKAVNWLRRRCRCRHLRLFRTNKIIWNLGVRMNRSEILYTERRLSHSHTSTAGAQSMLLVALLFMAVETDWTSGQRGVSAASHLLASDFTSSLKQSNYMFIVHCNKNKIGNAQNLRTQDLISRYKALRRTYIHCDTFSMPRRRSKTKREKQEKKRETAYHGLRLQQTKVNSHSCSRTHTVSRVHSLCLVRQNELWKLNLRRPKKRQQKSTIRIWFRPYSLAPLPGACKAFYYYFWPFFFASHLDRCMRVNFKGKIST